LAVVFDLRQIARGVGDALARPVLRQHDIVEIDRRLAERRDVDAPRRRLDETRAARAPKLKWERPAPYGEAVE